MKNEQKLSAGEQFVVDNKWMPVGGAIVVMRVLKNGADPLYCGEFAQKSFQMNGKKILDGKIVEAFSALSESLKHGVISREEFDSIDACLKSARLNLGVNADAMDSPAG